MKDIIQHIHLIGIGGVGMAGIAEVLHTLGYTVTGSDIKQSVVVQRLKQLGVTVQIGHEPDLVVQAEVVVVSSAIDESNPEIQCAQQQRIPIIPRAEMLAELMRERFGIAVAGTHGKTTTTSLVASILTEAGMDPTYVIGGRLNQSGTNAALGQGKWLVAEADESDASFMHLKPMISIITNIDADHMETYQGDFQVLEQTFVRFVQNLPFYGTAVVCWDDDTVRELAEQFRRTYITYGFHEDADVRATQVITEGLCSRFQVFIYRDMAFEVTLNMPGLHNVQNALAAIAVAHKLGADVSAMQRALQEFRGVGRRFEVYANVDLGGKSVTLVDDYGHHPTELAAVLDAARRAFDGQRLVVVFQPHRFSRTRDCFDDFARVLSQADLLILTPVFAAGETELPQYNSKSLMQQVRLISQGQSWLADDLDQLPELFGDLLQEDDVVLTLGAGNIGAASAAWRATTEVTV